MKNSLGRFSKSNIYKIFYRSAIISPIISLGFVVAIAFLSGSLWYLYSGHNLEFNPENMIFRAQYKLEVCEHLKKDISEVWNYSLDILASIVNIFTIESASLTALGALLVTIYINVRTETKDYNFTSQARKAYIRAYRKFLFILIYSLSSIFYTHGLVRFIDPTRIVSVELKNISQPWIYFFFGSILVVIYSISGKTADMYNHRVNKFLQKNFILYKKFVDNEKSLKLKPEDISIGSINTSAQHVRHDNYIKRFFFVLSGYLGLWRYSCLIIIFVLVNSSIPILVMYFQLFALRTGDKDGIMDSFFQVNMIFYMFLSSLFIALIYLFIFPILSLYVHLYCGKGTSIACYTIIFILLVAYNCYIFISYFGGYIKIIELFASNPYEEIHPGIQALNLFMCYIFPLITSSIFMYTVYGIYEKKYIDILGSNNHGRLSDFDAIFCGIFVDRLLYLWNMALSAYEDEMLFEEESKSKENMEDVYRKMYGRFEIIQNNIMSDSTDSKDRLSVLPPYFKLYK